MKYTAVIRTLGTAGEKYQQLLNSLENQTIQPQEIIVYIADGYSLPEETIGRERYVYVKKGMVAQRALEYKEVDTEYILFCDDDIYLPPNSVEELYLSLKDNNAQVISPDVFDNAQRGLRSEFAMTISGRMRARRYDKIWGYKVMRTGGFSYNKYPHEKVYQSQTNAGPCFFCSKKDFLKIKFEEEFWMDKMIYTMGEDQVMFYKMHCMGMKVLTHYKSGIIHLDAGTARISQEKENKTIYSDFYIKIVFWHRFIFLLEKNIIMKLWSILCISYAFLFSLIISLFKCRFDILKLKYNAICAGINFIKSEEYNSLPRI